MYAHTKLLLILKFCSLVLFSSFVLHKMKPKKTYFHNSNVIYKFQCPCSSTYIGETVKLLELRIFQHRTHRTSHVFKHITNFIPYKTSLENTFGNQPNDDEKREHSLNGILLITSHANYLKE